MFLPRPLDAPAAAVSVAPYGLPRRLAGRVGDGVAEGDQDEETTPLEPAEAGFVEACPLEKRHHAIQPVAAITTTSVAHTTTSRTTASSCLTCGKNPSVNTIRISVELTQVTMDRISVRFIVILV